MPRQHSSYIIPLTEVLNTLQRTNVTLSGLSCLRFAVQFVLKTFSLRPRTTAVYTHGYTCRCMAWIGSRWLDEPRPRHAPERSDWLQGAWLTARARWSRWSGLLLCSFPNTGTWVLWMWPILTYRNVGDNQQTKKCVWKIYLKQKAIADRLIEY